MRTFAEERRSVAGVAILARTTSRISVVLDSANIAYRSLLVQHDTLLPALRPPVLLDTNGLSVVELATVLEQLSLGCVPCWPARTPLPTIAAVDPLAFAHVRLLADCPAVAAIVASSVSPTMLATVIRNLGTPAASEREGLLCVGVPLPHSPACCPQVGRTLLALHHGATIAAAAQLAHLSRAGLQRRLEQLPAVLTLSRPAGHDSITYWRARLLAALQAPIE